MSHDNQDTSNTTDAEPVIAVAEAEPAIVVAEAEPAIAIIDMLMESLRNFHNKTGRDENTQRNGKMFEEHVKTALLSIGYSNVSNFSKILYKNLLADIKKCYTTTLNIPNTKGMQPRRLLFQQPYGSQSPPDFLLVDILTDTIHFQPVEVKTGKKAATWNNNYPKDEWIYIFYGEKGVTYFRGKKLIHEQVKELFDEYKRQRQELTIQFNKRLEEMKETWKLIDYFKFEHTGKVDYHRDDSRHDRERDVADALLMLSNLAL